MSTACSCSVVFLLVFGLAWPSDGKSFMPRQEEVEASLLAELAGTFWSSATQDHVISLEAALRPMYAAVPQEADGRLSQTVVRYVLHRFFAKRGWSFRGLEPGSGMGNRSSGDLQGLPDWVPSYLTAFLEKMSGGRGIALRELAIIVATLEDLVHKEMTAHLDQAFDTLGLPYEDYLHEEEVSAVLEHFLLSFLIRRDFSVTGRSKVQIAGRSSTKTMRDSMKEWMQTIRKTLYPGASDLDYNAVVHIAEEIVAKYGEDYNQGCMAMKRELLDVESQKAGRVRLPDFYRKGLDGGFPFTEKVEYLRALGLLDESDPKQPHVVISNYMGYHGHCIELSSFYQFCCASQCEHLMGKLENAIASEMALPDQIIRLVSALSSDTVTAPRTLSLTLTGRLHSIAKSNAGQIPLHGRLFAQWMHHAFPRECPFPHDGNLSFQTPNKWLQESGHETSKASIEDMKAHVSGDTDQKPNGAEARKYHNLAEHELQWSEFEEPLMPFGNSARSQPRSTSRAAGVFAMLLSMASGLILAIKVLLAGADEQKCLPNLAFGSINFAKEAGKLV